MCLSSGRHRLAPAHPVPSRVSSGDVPPAALGSACWAEPEQLPCPSGTKLALVNVFMPVFYSAAWIKLMGALFALTF